MIFSFSFANNCRDKQGISIFGSLLKKCKKKLDFVAFQLCKIQRRKIHWDLKWNLALRDFYLFDCHAMQSELVKITCNLQRD